MAKKKSVRRAGREDRARTDEPTAQDAGSDDLLALTLPPQLAAIFLATALGLCAVLLVHVILVSYNLSQRPVLLDQLTTSLEAGGDNGSHRYQHINESLRLAATAAEWDTALQLRAARMTSAILGGLILLVTGTMLISAVVLGSSGVRSSRNVPASRRRWYFPGVLLSLAGATLFGAALAIDVKVEHPVDLDAIEAKYVRDFGVDKDVEAIEKAQADSNDS